jgi:hypothetical protein
LPCYPFLLCPIVKCVSGHIKSYYRKEFDEINSFKNNDFDAERMAPHPVPGRAQVVPVVKKPRNPSIGAPFDHLFRATAFSRSNEISSPGEDTSLRNLDFLEL